MSDPATDAIAELVADVEASGCTRAQIAADAGMPESKLSAILERKQLPTVVEYFAIRKAIGRETQWSDDAVADLERLRVALATDADLTEILEDLLRRMEK